MPGQDIQMPSEMKHLMARAGKFVEGVSEEAKRHREGSRAD